MSDLPPTLALAPLASLPRKDTAAMTTPPDPLREALNYARAFEALTEHDDIHEGTANASRAVDCARLAGDLALVALALDVRRIADTITAQPSGLVEFEGEVDEGTLEAVREQYPPGAFIPGRGATGWRGRT
jgi:hypothetical protein